MTEIEQQLQENQKFIKKVLQVRLSLLEMMIEGQIITISSIVNRTKIPRGSVYKYVERLSNEGRLVVIREKEDRKSKIVDMNLTKDCIKETYGIFPPNITRSDIERILINFKQKTNIS